MNGINDLEASFAPDPMSDEELEQSLRATHSLTGHKRQVRKVVAGSTAFVVLLMVGVLAWTTQQDKPQRLQVANPEASAPGAIDGDIDGDGKVDEVDVALAADGKSSAIVATMTTAGIKHFTFATATDDNSTVTTPEVMGVVDADQNGNADIFVNTQFDSHPTLTTMIVFVDGELRFAEGNEFSIGFGDTGDYYTKTFVCSEVSSAHPGREIIGISAQSHAGVTQVSQIVYSIDRGNAITVSNERLEIPERSLSNESRSEYGGPPRCGSLGTPPGAMPPTKPFSPIGPKPAIDGDVDGDGKMDSVSIEFVETPGDVGVVTVTAATGTKGTLRVPYRVEGGAARQDPKIMGVIDGNHDGLAEIYVIDFFGSSVASVSVIELVGYQLDLVETAEVRSQGTEPGALPALGNAFILKWGENATETGSFRCEDVSAAHPGQEIIRTGAYNDGATTHGTIEVFSLAAGTATELSKESPVVDENSLSDASRARFGGPVSCGSLEGNK